MKIVTKTVSGTNETEYTSIRDLHYAPSVDVVSNRVAIDEFECDILTDDTVTTGLVAELRDDNSLWMSGRIVYAQPTERGIVHIIVQSELFFLDRKNMAPKMYTGQSVETAVNEIAGIAGVTILFDSTAVSGKTVSGFCEEQTCRERLQQILFVNGLYITSSFVEHPKVTALVNSDPTVIPPKLTYWKPIPSYKETVTAVNVTAFSYQQGTPTSEDEYVTDGTTTWIVTRQEVTLRNPNVPALSATNEIYVDDVGLITQSNASAVVSFLGTYYFISKNLEAEVLNNGEYFVGEKYNIAADIDAGLSVEGYAESLDYSFGLQSKSKMVLGACEDREMHKLTVVYRRSSHQDVILDREVFTLPEGLAYEITTRYIRKSLNGYEYVFRPTQETISGTMGQSDTTVYVNCDVALRLDLLTRVLVIVSVDEFEKTSRVQSGETIYTLEIE